VSGGKLVPEAVRGPQFLSGDLQLRSAVTPEPDHHVLVEPTVRVVPRKDFFRGDGLTAAEYRLALPLRGHVRPAGRYEADTHRSDERDDTYRHSQSGLLAHAILAESLTDSLMKRRLEGLVLVGRAGRAVEILRESHLHLVADTLDC